MLDVNLEDNYYVMYHLHLVFKSRIERELGLCSEISTYTEDYLKESVQQKSIT